ncbi:hypothetical protein CEUSTIGMA_g8717.t1 [Chlamydomonas eustigma]|uniref:DUF1308 domain-containing protein n=1 Tax=Chlamydomonas eustigma TaxID=1157962 RepID=A0A250XDX4_9CHLO|nr:hypothetical protein CEUSTIGMA_g8717.t1 [Chlamydomonas eustigma]|eukprot:GAX81285.1 hypothetical protein CEUSTIGMA_g8717.t1 [Chlamydomonas eustigma]
MHTKWEDFEENSTKMIGDPREMWTGLLHTEFKGSLDKMERTPTLQELRDILSCCVEMALDLAKYNANIDNVDRVLRRIRGDLAFVVKCLEASHITDVSEPLKLQQSSEQTESLIITGQSFKDQEIQTLEGQTELQNENVMVREDQKIGADVARSKIQGIVNNIRGFQGELLAAHAAPGVVGLMKRFSISKEEAAQLSSTLSQEDSGSQRKRMRLQPENLGTTTKCPSLDSANASLDSANVSTSFSSSGPMVERPQDDIDRLQSSSTASASGALSDWCTEKLLKGKKKLEVEVDVIAQDGSAWIEVKSQEIFGLESIHWTGAPTVKGLQQQVQELLLVAQCERHWRRWTAPRIVLFFPSGTDDGVKHKLQAMGILVAEGVDALTTLPPAPAAPRVANLDVTTMCALVSEVCHAELEDLRLEAWSERNIHWRECWLEERNESRVMMLIGPTVEAAETLVASVDAINQFMKLLQQFGGPTERVRWEALYERLTIHPSSISAEVKDQLFEPKPGNCSFMTDRVSNLKKVTELQRTVFGLGDALQAVTLTANGSAARSALRQGVILELVVHRAVWLTGL